MFSFLCRMYYNSVELFIFFSFFFNSSEELIPISLAIFDLHLREIPHLVDQSVNKPQTFTVSTT